MNLCIKGHHAPTSRPAPEKIAECKQIILSDDVIGLEQLFKDGFPMNFTDFSGTLLFKAIEVKSNNIVAYLLSHGASVNITNNSSSTPLICAIYWGNVKAVEMLIAAEANVNLCDRLRQSPLFFASSRGDSNSLTIISMLITAQADVNRASKCGMSPLMVASQAGNTAAMSLLINAGALVNQRNQTQRTSLMFASEQGRVDAVRMLLHNGANMRDMDVFSHRNSLSLAAANGHTETVRVLLQHERDSTGSAATVSDLVMMCDSNGCSPIHHAITQHHHDCVRVMLDVTCHVIDSNMNNNNKNNDNNDYDCDRPVLHPSCIPQDQLLMLLDVAIDHNNTAVGQIILDFCSVSSIDRNNKNITTEHDYAPPQQQQQHNSTDSKMSNSLKNVDLMLLSECCDVSGKNDAPLTPITTTTATPTTTHSPSIAAMTTTTTTPVLDLLEHATTTPTTATTTTTTTTPTTAMISFDVRNNGDLNALLSLLTTTTPPTTPVMMSVVTKLVERIEQINHANHATIVKNTSSIDTVVVPINNHDNNMINITNTVVENGCIHTNTSTNADANSNETIHNKDHDDDAASTTTTTTTTTTPTPPLNLSDHNDVLRLLSLLLSHAHVHLHSQHNTPTTTIVNVVHDLGGGMSLMNPDGFSMLDGNECVDNVGRVEHTNPLDMTSSDDCSHE